MSEHEEEKKAFQVKDRRRFDASGNLRPSDEEERERSAPAAPRAAPPPPRAAQPPPRAEPQREEWRSEWEDAQQEAKDAMDAAAESHARGPVSFAEFVLSIATNAVIHLGADTKDGRLPPRVNLTLAAQHIDIVAMLAEKTRGNLDKEEQELIDSLLYDLRMKYVAVAQAQSRGR